MTYLDFPVFLELNKVLDDEVGVGSVPDVAIQVSTSYNESGMHCVYSLINTQISPFRVGLGTPCPV